MNKSFDFKNLRVLNTRPKHLAGATSKVIHDAGGISIEFPLLNIESTDSTWINTLPSLEKIQHAIFISPNAVTYFFNQYSKKKWPHTITTYALGPGTKNALKTHNILTTICPTKADSEHLLMLDTLQSIQHQNILLIKGKNGRTLIQDTLSTRAANVIAIDVYQRTLPKLNPTYMHALWHEDAVDIILITSETALRHLFILFGEKATPWLCSKPCLVMSTRLAKAAEAQGFKTIIKGLFLS
ncbi:MAG: uroporphyrinogen-III synthase [Gammaproteobacteria bacterium]|nr:uroporphyrinogen-III synthase [Gammaproteobacteria bacterium]